MGCQRQFFHSALALFAAVMLWPHGALAKDITIATAGVTGVYYPAGGAICRLVNRSKKEHGIHCHAESSKGSVRNLDSLGKGEIDFAVVQSDWQYFYSQEEVKKGEDLSDLRFVFSLHTEPFTIMVRADSDIRRLEDLRGKRVNVGPKEAGVWRTLDAVLSAKNWGKQVFGKLTNYKWEEQGNVLCSKQVDALVMTIGHPNGNLQKVVHECDVRLIGLSKNLIKTIVTNRPYLTPAVVRGGMYPGNPYNIYTFGVKATVVTPESTDEKVVYEVTKAMLSNLDNFKTLHPVFATLDKSAMSQAGKTVPMHPGALRYYKEVGLLPEATQE